MHKWPPKSRFGILRVNGASGSAVAAALLAIHPRKLFPPVSQRAPDWIGIPATNPPSCELGERCHHFILGGGNTQIFCVFGTTILFLCLIKLHSEHSIIKTRPEFTNKWSLYYVGQRKDKLYAWKVSLSCVIHTNQRVGKDKIFFFFLIFLFSQQLNQSYKICIKGSSGGKKWVT